MSKSINNQINVFLNIIFSICWIFLLTNTDSYFLNYALICMCSLIIGFRKERPLQKGFVVWFFSFLLSFLVTIANYNFVSRIGMFLLFLSGVFVFKNILSLFYFKIDNISEKKFNNKNVSAKKVFWLTFLVIIFIDLLVLFLSQYPGVLTTDSVNQLTQIDTGVYSNHHPFWHTMIIKGCYNIGLFLFKNPNAAVATYSVVQILTMALIESYANLTLCQLGSNKFVNVVFCLFFAIVPYNIMYSFTMWKDILFGGFVLLFLTCLVRIFENIGNDKYNYILLTISSIGFCLLRSNGWIAFIFSFVLFIILFFKKYKKAAVIMLICLCCTSVLKNQVMDSLNITQPDLVESLAIPTQQVSKVVVENKDLTKEELEFINNVVPIEKIKEKHLSWTVDEVKFAIRDYGNQQFLKDNLKEALQLYLKLGLKYPITYFTAWVDETRGFFNNGYEFWIARFDVRKNDLGIHNVEISPLVSNIIKTAYNSCYLFLCPIISIGLHVWIILGCLFVGLMKKNSKICMLTIPVLAIIATLLIATPISYEFRYAYAVFTSTLFIVFSTIGIIRK